jgi:hypothetical protein
MRLLLVLGLLLLTTTVHAKPPIPAHTWTPQARIWLARALVGESGWDNRLDQAAVAWVLAKRWERYRPDLFHFEGMVKAYACPVKWGAPRPWVRQLPADGWTRPRQWKNSMGPWGAVVLRWQGVLEFVDHWAAGEVPDPIPEANHYGSPTDPALPGCVRVSPKWGANVFYVCRSSTDRH